MQPSPQLIKLHPLLTYNPATQSLDLHSLSQLGPFNGQLDQPISFIGIVEVRSRDYRLFQLEDSQVTGHGIHVSAPLQTKEQGKVCYLVLPANQAKISQKYQDLLAGMILSLSKTCVFDISSKYLRQSKNIEGGKERHNFVVMNSNSYSGGGGEIYRASFTVQSGNSKMEISTKLTQDTLLIFQELVRGVGDGLGLRDITRNMESVLSRQIMLKNYLNLDQLQHRFHTATKLALHLPSTEYSKLCQHQMLSLQEMQTLCTHIRDFSLPEFTTAEQIQILNKCKEELIQNFIDRNRGLVDGFMLGIRREYFQSVSGLGQLYIKRELAEKILAQYGISPIYNAVLYSEVEQKLQCNEIKRINSILYEKQKKIKQLTAIIQQNNETINKNKELIVCYQQKSMDFKQLNLCYIQKCDELARERESGARAREEIEDMLVEQQRRQRVEEGLHSFIGEIQDRKEQQEKLISTLHADIRNKEQCIMELQDKNSSYENKIRSYQNLQSQAWKSIEETQQARDELSRYKDLVRKLEEHFQAFKRNEVEKFNYVLTRNYDVYSKTKKELDQKVAIIGELEGRIGRLQGELEEEKARLRFCEEQAYSLARGQPQSKSMCEQQRKSLGPNRSFISAI